MMNKPQGRSRNSRSKRSHQKSRLGCKNCKRRRVKCDEKKPSCSNCVRHFIDCDFDSTTESASISPGSSALSPPAPPSNRRFQFKQSKYQSLICSSSKDRDPELDFNPFGAPFIFPITQHTALGISFSDLQLFHHFVTSTYRTMADESDHSNGVWQIHIPQWSFTFPSILHLMLALSALHSGSQRPERQEQCMLQAISHFSSGINSVTSILPQLDSEICQVVYMSAVLICFVYFGRGPQPGEYLAFSEAGRSEFMVLMRGVRSILQSRHDQIFTGVLAPKGENRAEHVSSSLEPELREHQAHLEEIRGLCQSRLDREMHISAIDSLASIFDEVYKVRSLGKDGVSLMHLVIAWIYRLPGSFLSLLEEKEPYSMVILAYWCILLKYMGTSWLITGWDKHVLAGVSTSLSVDYQQWIQWPVKVIHGFCL